MIAIWTFLKLLARYKIVWPGMLRKIACFKDCFGKIGAKHEIFIEILTFYLLILSNFGRKFGTFSFLKDLVLFLKLLNVVLIFLTLLHRLLRRIKNESISHRKVEKLPLIVISDTVI